MAVELLSFSNAVFSTYAFYGTLVLLKMFVLAFLTSAKRGQKQAFANPEDAKYFGKKKDDKVTFSDPDVERVRRNHLNDLENIPAFLFLGLLYVLTNPSPSVAVWHFRVFVASRFAHTFVYQAGIPQPSRALTFLVGLVTCISMAVQILLVAR